MKTFAFLFSLFICLFVMVFISLPDKHWGTKNCELAEISPDFTLQEKADCRMMKGQK